MGVTSFSDIELSRDEIKALNKFADEKNPKQLKDYTYLSLSEYKALFALGFVVAMSEGDKEQILDPSYTADVMLCHISEEGKRFLRYYSKKQASEISNKLDRWITRILSAIAIVISIIALIRSW